MQSVLPPSDGCKIAGPKLNTETAPTQFYMVYIACGICILVLYRKPQTKERVCLEYIRYNNCPSKPVLDGHNKAVQF